MDFAPLKVTSSQQVHGNGHSGATGNGWPSQPRARGPYEPDQQPLPQAVRSRIVAVLSPSPQRRRLYRWLAIFALVAQLAFLGLVLRVWVFQSTAKIRFQWDLDNAWNRGTQALQIGPGYWSGIVAMYQPQRNTGIDYPPIRMYIKTAWVGLCHYLYGPGVRRTDAVMWPMLAVNYIVELAGAIGMYFLCRLFSNWQLSLLAAICLWFNPGVIVNTFVWTQWDVWVVAPTVWATWAFFRRRYFLAGTLLGLGSMMKGQTLFVTPWFLLMMLFLPPLFAIRESLAPRRIHARLRKAYLATAAWGVSAFYRIRMMLAGFALAVFISVLPFTLHDSFDWFQVYHHQVHMYQGMAIGTFNLPLVMGHFGWGGSQMIWRPDIFGWHPAYSIMTWLTVLFAAWVVVIAAFSARARNNVRVLLGPAAVFAAMYAVLPGMHERYTLYAAALLAPAVCVGPAAAFLYLLVTAMAVASPLHSCLGQYPQFAPKWFTFFNQGWNDFAWLWIFCAVALTHQIYLLPRARPRPVPISPLADAPLQRHQYRAMAEAFRRAAATCRRAIYNAPRCVRHPAGQRLRSA